MTSARQHSQRHVISVLIADRAGILRDITGAVTSMGANIDGVRQSVVAGYFTVMLTATFPEPSHPDDVCKRMLKAFEPGEAQITVIPYDARKAKPAVFGERYMVTITGEDHTGILKAVTGFLAERGINIEDWDVDFNGTRVTHVGQVTVPSRLDIKQLQVEFRHLADSLSLRAGIQHENIFRAISEVGPIKPLVTCR